MANKKKSTNQDGGKSNVDLIDKKKSKDRIKPPSKYQVVFYNDNFTPMNLVASLLIKLYHHSEDNAWKITLDIHEKGKGIAGGPYPKGIAETKSNKTVDIARYMGYPLLAKSEKV